MDCPLSSAYSVHSYSVGLSSCLVATCHCAPLQPQTAAAAHCSSLAVRTDADCVLSVRHECLRCRCRTFVGCSDERSSKSDVSMRCTQCHGSPSTVQRHVSRCIWCNATCRVVSGATPRVALYLMQRHVSRCIW